MDTTREKPTNKLLLSKRDAALALSLSVRTVENLIHCKALAARHVGRRTLVLASSLRAFVEKDHASPSPNARSKESPGGS